VSFIGSLEQLSLPVVLQKIENEAKNGVLIVKQEAQWVELSFRQGQLMCIGPVRSNKTIADRLLRAGVISQKALQEISSISGLSLQNETRTVVTLIKLAYLKQENLYIWATQEATKILQVLIGWTSGELYFEEGLQPPPDRLLIALTVSSLVTLPTPITSSQIPDASVSSMHAQKQTEYRATTAQIPDSLTLHDPSQFYGTSATTSASNSKDPSDSCTTNGVRNTDALFAPANPINRPERLTGPLVPQHISTGLMQPQMVLHPTDLSGLRDQNLQVQLTPEQWRLFTVADDHTTLQMACQQLIMSREMVCQVAGELVALNLITLSLPTSGFVLDSSSFTPDVAKTSLANNNVAWTQLSRDSFSSPPVETHSQWGNGGTGATFVLGNGWVVASSPSQSSQSIELYDGRKMDYVAAAGM
jgi:Domain of unknown function (DUF4388)